MTLALLITAVGGAWAQDPVDGTIAWSKGNEASATVSASIKDAISSTGVTTGSGLTVGTANYFETSMVRYQPATTNAGNVEGVMIEYTIEAVDGYKFKPTGVDYAAVQDGTDKASYSWSYTIDGVESAITDVSNTSVLRNNGSNSGTAQLMHNESITAEGCSVFTLRFYISNCGTSKDICIGNITISGSVSVAEAPIKVTTNAASEQDLFTEASFTMPAFDATADYELVRDMSVQMTATMGDGSDGLRYRVKKAQQGQGYEPADMDMTQVLALVAVNDAIEQKDLTLDQDYYCRIYKLDEQTLQPEGDGVELTDFDFAPGLYALKAFAMDGSNYAGETALSNTFKLFQGYELTVAPGDYATYYRTDDALYLEDTDAQLYTITAVSGQTATAQPISVAPAGTPVLVKNNSTDPEKTTILLIPTTDQQPDVTVYYGGFKGTLEGQQISSTATTDCYVMTGKQFVWLKDAGTIAAQRCWLEVPKTSAQSAPVISIVIDGMSTGIDGLTPTLSEGEGDWYDLNGRKLNKKPTAKGVYVVNGKKVVVK